MEWKNRYSTCSPVETNAQRLFQGGTEDSELRGIVASSLNPCEAVARIGGKQPGQVFRFGQGSPVGQGAGQKYSPSPAPISVRAKVRGVLQGAVSKVFGAVSQAEGFERGRMTSAASSPTRTKSCVFVTSTRR